MILEVIAAFLTSVGFGVLFNVKGKYLVVAGVGGGLSWFVYKLFLGFDFKVSTAFFIASICFSIYCEVCARIYKTPATILSVCCLIPLVPGYGVYNTMYQFLRGNYMEAIDCGINTLSSAGGLALGVILVSTLFRNIKFNKIYASIVKKFVRVDNHSPDVQNN
ncbi:threonine/serine exporter [Romboutsia maritimum]|uniref:Threonine/serine exporter n=1 Tax=Romboutsia maritimum TaxID=2020948 RepID=A0A371ITD5_9FIRM|nr:threonine/serine exporter family protein [Romboutsia maritimum]RDY23744.1 threonine/serine exporter [Romboutsia maritimum]